jgi:hypothetical protein
MLTCGILETKTGYILQIHVPRKQACHKIFLIDSDVETNYKVRMKIIKLDKDIQN